MPPRHRLVVALSALIALAACADAPMDPRVLLQSAGGEAWGAVSPPAGLPQLRTWLPYLREGASQAGLQRVRELEREAERLRREGQLARAQAAEEEATRVAVLSLPRSPEPAVLRSSLFAIDLWCERVRARADVPLYHQLDSAYVAVRAQRTRAGEALASGDTTTAVLLLAEAAERIRAQSPSAVALRVLARAEETVRAQGLSGADARRALHLIGAAREEVVRGDPGRALRRALYALQLLDGALMDPGAGAAPEPCEGRARCP